MGLSRGFCLGVGVTMVLMDLRRKAPPVPLSSVSCDVAKHPASSSTARSSWLPKTHVERCPLKTLEQIEPDRRSQQKEDLVLFEIFNGFCGGTYIEMGALDGVFLSNSYVFNKQFDFKGLLIELTPKKAELAQKNRPNELTDVVNAAVCSEKKDLHWVENENRDNINGVWEVRSKLF